MGPCKPCELRGSEITEFFETIRKMWFRVPNHGLLSPKVFNEIAEMGECESGAGRRMLGFRPATASMNGALLPPPPHPQSNHE